MAYTLFGYGSLIWKPPPHTKERVPGYIKGFVRRFWQSSNDHRGTPENPGRVVTLISRSFWSALHDPHPYGFDDVVWGVAYKIEASKSQEVEEYMDYREKNGYSKIQVLFQPADGSMPFECTVYVGLPDNEAFIGPQDPEDLAAHIVRSSGPSGPNKEYLYNLAAALDQMNLRTGDAHIVDLVERCRRLEQQTLLEDSSAAEALSRAN